MPLCYSGASGAAAVTLGVTPEGSAAALRAPWRNDQTTSRSERRGLGGRAKRTGT